MSTTESFELLTTHQEHRDNSDDHQRLHGGCGQRYGDGSELLVKVLSNGHRHRNPRQADLLLQCASGHC